MPEIYCLCFSVLPIALLPPILIVFNSKQINADATTNKAIESNKTFYFISQN